MVWEFPSAFRQLGRRVSLLPAAFTATLLLAVVLVVWSAIRADRQSRELESYIEVRASEKAGHLVQALECASADSDSPTHPSIDRVMQGMALPLGFTFATLLDSDDRVLATVRAAHASGQTSVTLHRPVRLSAERTGTLRVGLSAEPLLVAHRVEWRRTVAVTAIAFALALLLAVVVYVWQRRLMLDTLRERSLNEAVLAGMGDAVVVIDSEERIQLLNPAAQRLFGVASADLIGKRSQDAPFAVVARELDGSDPSREVEMEVGDGPRTTVLASISHVRDDQGHCVGRALILRDRTLVRRLEAEEQTTRSLAALGRLAETMAHEVRNPLNAIAVGVQRLRLEGLQRPNGTAPQRMLALIQYEVQRLDGIVKSYLDRARPRKLDPRLGDLDTVLESMLPLLRGGCPPGIEIAFERGGVPPAVFDPFAVRQVVLNLVRNSIEALPDRGTIVISTEPGSDGIRMTVTDDGPGIPLEDRHKVLEFGYSTKPDGNGVGLPIVQHLVAEMHGRLEIASHGRGARVCVTLPREAEVVGTGRGPA